MARTGLSKLQVKAAREQLIADGRYPSVDAVRLALGNTGSKTTIHRYLKELDIPAGDATLRRDDTAQALQAMVQQLADKLHDDAETRLRTLRADYEAALRHKEQELAALRAEVAALRARVDAPSPRKSIRAIGFGMFSNLLSATRGARGDASPFSNLMTGGRSEILDPASLAASGLTFR